MLIKDWTFRYETLSPISCSAPCSMYSVLLENKIISDPFYGLNEKELTKYSEKDCVFEAEFNVSSDDAEKTYCELVFYGLDTICSIFLNDKNIGETRNMHRTYVFNVKPYINAGKNTLRLHFSSPVQYFEKMNHKHFLYTNADTLKGAAHLRKALYMSGWDWGPTLPDMGIFRDIELRFYDYDRIADVEIRQEHKDGVVKLIIRAETMKNACGCELFAEIDRQRVKLSEGKAEIVITNPQLWWVRGYGEQNLYDFSLWLLKDGAVLDEVYKKIGLRTLTVSKDKDSDGEEFCFVNNGIKIFAMGANYIPQDNLLSRVTPETTRKLLKSCIDANFNCVRVWGGGYYPDDYFYDMCDELGLFVWQDFMIACVNVWMRDEFEEEMRREAEDNVKRLRHHASFGLLCGNNEVEGMLFDSCKAESGLGIVDSELVKLDYLLLYERLLPDLCERLAPDVYYLPSSPTSGGGFDCPHDASRGDVHFWEVWHGGKPFSEYRKHRFRFCSEYGFESFPSMKTIEAFCPEKEKNPFSPVMENHQKCKGGNVKIMTYLASEYLYPYRFEDLVYASQLIQADAIRYGVEHFRRLRGCCMGSIYWQVNDCWPVASWSSVDYFGRYKALHYAAKKFYAPVTLGIFNENGKMVVNVSNETRNAFSGKLQLYLCKNNFDVVKEASAQITIPPLTSLDVEQMEIEDEIDAQNTYFYARLSDADGNEIVQLTELFEKPKRYHWQKPEIKVDVKREADRVKLCFSADCFCKGVFIDFDGFDVTLSDNFFDITSEKRVKITAYTNKTAKELIENMRIKTVYDIGR